jgi:hypothetical protein
MSSTATAAFCAFSSACPHRIEPTLERRPGNALNIEIGQPSARCRLRPPRHWGAAVSVARWLLSGGDPMVLGYCSRAGCKQALGQEWCECGHRLEHHSQGGCKVGGLCGCDCTAAGTWE